MTGYNPLNGTYCTENKWLIDVLKKDWGFKGMLMSDWACTYSADKAANNGLDLEMGSKDWFNRQRLLPLIKKRYRQRSHHQRQGAPHLRNLHRNGILRPRPTH